MIASIALTLATVPATMLGCCLGLWHAHGGTDRRARLMTGLLGVIALLLSIGWGFAMKGSC